MSWYSSEAPPDFVDAERIHRALERVTSGANLYESTTEKYPDCSDAPDDPFDEPAFLYLVEQEFVDVPTDLRNAIDKFRHLDREGERTRVELQNVYRRLKTMAVQLRKADKDLEGGMANLLKSKSQRWEERARRDALAHDIDELTLRRRRLESDLEKAGTLFKELLDRTFKDQRLREAYWYQDMPVVMTKYGVFLLSYLAEMNPEHFRGRTLAEILEIGPSLA